MRKSWGEKRNLERVLGEGGFSLSSLWRGVENGTLPLPLPQSLKPSGRSSNRLSPEGEAGSHPPASCSLSTVRGLACVPCSLGLSVDRAAGVTWVLETLGIGRLLEKALPAEGEGVAPLL